MGAGALLDADGAARRSVAEAAVDPFFGDLDVFTLYRRPRGPAIASAAAAPARQDGDERWQKRQFSKIWTVAPSPQDYAPEGSESRTPGPKSGSTVIRETSAERGNSFSS